MARKHGAVLLEKTPVKSVRANDKQIEVVAKGTTYRCRKLVITAGPWSNSMLGHLGHNLPLTITQEQVTYFKPNNPRGYLPTRFPVWIWIDEPCFYGFPIYGENGVKVGQDVGGREVTAETRTFKTDTAALRRVKAFLRKYLPSAADQVIYVKSCLYTLTPDRDFVIDTVPGFPNISVAIGAGHGFKFASLIGKILSELAIYGKSRYDIRAFRIDRSILMEKHPKRHFMV
jgi:sarcosine oxidase